MMYISNLLFSLGAHIGGKKYNMDTYYQPFLIGYRFSYCIYDMNYIVFFLQRSSTFFYFLGYNNCKFLFYFENLLIHHNFLFKSFFFFWLNRTNQFYIDERWKFGMLSNMMTYCNQLFDELFQLKKQFRNRKFFYFTSSINFNRFFFRLLFFTLFNRIPGIDWNQHLNRIKKYWRFFLFFKFYKHLNRFPDAFFYLTDSNFSHPAIECYNLNIPIVGSLDSNFKFFRYITYPIVGNSSSPFLHLLYFLSMMKSYERGMISSYRMIQ